MGNAHLADCLDEGLAEVADHLEGMPTNLVGTKVELRKIYADTASEDAFSRWGRLGILAGTVAHLAKA